MNEYPADDELQALTDFNVTKDNFHVFMEKVKELWNWNDTYFIRKGDTYELHTGGWSGNESIIDALGRNFVFWLLYWKQTRVGGHYIFSSSKDWNGEDALHARVAKLEGILKEVVAKLSDAPNTNNYDWEHWRVEFCIKYREEE